MCCVKVSSIQAAFPYCKQHTHTLSAAVMTGASGLDSTWSFTLSTCSKVGLPTSSATGQEK